jgi:hypothetical protein
MQNPSCHYQPVLPSSYWLVISTLPSFAPQFVSKFFQLSAQLDFWSPR